MRADKKGIEAESLKMEKERNYRENGASYNHGDAIFFARTNPCSSSVKGHPYCKLEVN